VGLTAGVMAITFLIPYLPGTGVLGFEPMPSTVLAVIVVITLLYVAATEFAKTHFFRRFD
jgi:Mg2+-importing ATPase